MRVLNYAEVFDLFNKEALTIDFDDKIYAGKTPQEIVTLDFELRDRSFNGNLSADKPEFANGRFVKLHSMIVPNIYHTFRGGHVCVRGRIERIPLVESISSKDRNIFGIIELSAEMTDRGFTLVESSLVNINNRAVRSALVVNTDRWATIPDSAHIINMCFTL